MPVPNPPVIAETQPAPPQRYVDDRETYSTRLDAWLSWFTTKAWVWLYDLVPWIQARANETEAWASAAAAVPNATVWVSGTTYAQYVAVIDPIKLLTYRRKTAAGSGTVRPELDATNWEPVTGTGNVTNTAANTFTAPQNFSAGITGVQLGKNLLINPLFTINQRGYIGGTATTTANQYTIDRWRVVTSGQSLSWTSNGNRLIVTAPAGGVEQIVEGNNIFGGSYALNWTGTATATVNGTPRTKGEVFTLLGGVNATVRFTGGTVDIPQLERGVVSTVIEDRFGGLELMLCQRYCEKSYPIDIAPGSWYGSATPNAAHGLKIYTSTTRAMGTQQFRVIKRAAPTVRYWDQAGNLSAFTVGDAHGGMQTNNFTADTFRSVYADTVSISANVDAASVVSPFTAFCHWEASAEL